METLTTQIVTPLTDEHCIGRLIINMINGISALISHHNLFIRLDNDKFCLNEQLLMNEPGVSCRKMDEELAI